MLFGSHLSVAGGLQNALIEAQRLGFTAVQVFTKNQRQWRAPALAAAQVELWVRGREETGIGTTVSHASYLINLASSHKTIRRRSLALFRDELERCARLGIPHLVIHPGAHMGAGEDRGIELVAQALDWVHGELPDCPVITCLEITAGQGTSLGYSFEHLRRMIDGARQPARLGVCLDTAHLLAAGYDLTSAAGCRAVLKEADRTLGLSHVRVFHLNDSKTRRGSRVDRHEHIGRGHVALEAFAVIVNDRRFRGLPMILETPKEKTADGHDWDAVNLGALQGMIRRRSGRRSSPQRHKDTKLKRQSDGAT